MVQKAWLLSARAHNIQEYPGSGLPYLYHIGAVCVEIASIIKIETHLDPDFMLCCAILHDIIEDTPITAEVIKNEFGENICNGVLALTKDKKLYGAKATNDSVYRITFQPKEVWCVKLADRIVNLGTPPARWTKDKIHSYAVEGGVINIALGSASPTLSSRLSSRVEAWKELSR